MTLASLGATHAPPESTRFTAGVAAHYFGSAAACAASGDRGRETRVAPWPPNILASVVAMLRHPTAPRAQGAPLPPPTGTQPATSAAHAAPAGGAAAGAVDAHAAIDAILAHIAAGDGRQPPLPEATAAALLTDLASIVAAQPPLLALSAPLVVVGNLNGHAESLVDHFRFNGAPPRTRYLFLGSYVNGGSGSLNVLLLLAALKIAYPHHVYLLRGVHESWSLALSHGFCDACKGAYNVRFAKLCFVTIAFMPVAATVGGALFCVNSGFPWSCVVPRQQPEIAFRTYAAGAVQWIANAEAGGYADGAGPAAAVPLLLGMQRPTTFGGHDLEEWLWNQPGPEAQATLFAAADDGGAGNVFSPQATAAFLRANGWYVLVRASRGVGGQGLCHGGRTLTLVGIRDYLNAYGNDAVALHVDGDLRLSYRTLPGRPAPHAAATDASQRQLNSKPTKNDGCVAS